MRKGILFGLLSLMAGCATQQADLAVQPDVDLKRYMGTWYEQARLPNKFQDRCVSDVRADYVLLADQRVGVTNQCKNQDGKIDQAQAIGRLNTSIQPPSTSILQVRFAPAWLSWLPAVWGDYWIMKIADDYQYSLVGTPNREYLWVLSREPQADKQRIQELLDYAQEQGFAVQKVLPTEHSALN